MRSVVFLDQMDTWHANLTAFAEKTAMVLSASGRIDSEFACDLDGLDLDDALAAEFKGTFESEMIACYHATRLLPHEVAGIAKDGLDVLSDELRLRKLSNAQEQYPTILSDEDVHLLMDGGPLSWQQGAVRNGSLCFVTPWTAVLGERSGLSYLVGRWGGEAIGWTSEETPRCEDVLQQLDELSTPAVVEFALSPNHFAWYRSAWFVPVAIVLGLLEPWTESRTTVSIPPDQIMRVRTANETDWPDDFDGTNRRP